ncbi:phage tail-collar fiber domain-containing protein [Pseudomonas putida]|uniref:Phage-related tail fibre protein-like protein n=1 Tax=Pseudomonas putida (strain W619) TaxID=390235 RepID=B1JB17_PSEPW|nr:phage tail protein [Pseudomonas putida]
MVDQTSQFYAILTNVGAAKQANADALGIAWKITQMGVGDANGTDPTPNATQTSLINEWRRAPLNQLKVDDNNNAIIIAEQVIPADVGGKWIREIALYDADGDMVAVANCAPTYKPLLSQGSGRTQVVRMNLVVSSASNVQLKIDPAVVLATREWVTEELARQDFKHSVLAATTANIPLNGLQTVDGVALTAGARVLVKNQTIGKDNGLYLVVAGGPWARCSDADTSAKVTPGMLVLVERGALNGNSAWQLLTDAPITLGVTALAYEMAFGRSGVAAGTYRSVSVDAYGRVTAATSPSTVVGYGLTDVYTKTQVDTAVAVKAPLASPTFTGVPAAPTAATGTDTTQLANTSFVHAAITAAGPVFNNSDDVTDWNAVIASGWNPKILGRNNANSPGQEVSYWYCLVLSYGGGSITQVAFPYGAGTLNGGIKTRSRYQGTWNDWVTPYTNTNVASVIKSLMAATTSAAALAAIGAAPVVSPVFTGVAAAPTSDQFDSTTKIATTEFVQRAIGGYQNGYAYTTAGQTITASRVNCLINLNTAASNITLPLLSSVPIGSKVYIRASNTATIKAQGTDVIYVNTAKTTESWVEVGRNSNITLISAGAIWFIAGNASLTHDTSLFGVLKGSNGYQKLPSGLILQWCNGQIAAAQGSARITLPETYTTSLVAYSLGTANAGHWVTGQNASTSGIDVIARTVSGGSIIVPSGIVGYTSIFIGY